MGKIVTSKELAKKKKEGEKNATSKCQGHLDEHNSYTNKTEKWTGKDGLKIF
jgi:hypothetical protein